MTSPATACDVPIRRHDLAFPDAAGWRDVLSCRPDLDAIPLVAGWADDARPLVARRAHPTDAPGVPLGLPLPPAWGKRRIAVVMPADGLVVTPPPSLSAAMEAAPRRWRPSLRAIGECAADQGAEVRVFGSLAWQALTGLAYLTEQSDLDILLHPGPDTDPLRLAAAIAGIDAAAPMRIDGELVRSDGLAVNWRELNDGARHVLAKSAAGVALIDADHFTRKERVS